MNSGKRDRYKKRYPLPAVKGSTIFCIFIRAFLQQQQRNRPPNIRVESLHADLTSSAFLCFTLAHRRRLFTVSAELCSPSSWPKLFYIPWYSGQSRKVATTRYISVLSIAEIISEDGFIIIEFNII